MIHIQNTPNLLGVTATGDIHDFEELYEVLHTIVGEEGEYIYYDAVRLRVLGVCYDIRHAMMGNRGAHYVPNGLEREQMKRLSITGSEMNIYLSFETYWPEMIFVWYALNDFIRLHEKHHKTHAWDATIATVRKLQAAVATCLEETLPVNKFVQLKRYMTPATTWVIDKYEGYATQYLDMLNIKFIEMDREKREKNLSIFAKRLAEQDQQYLKQKRQIEEVAREDGIHVNNVRYTKEYPEFLEW
ncbi:hypothetical protein C7437_1011460 [Psychrobacillus insolitus]|uniref:Uncharacterized protein n=1 Tax=Psychrobacillus insolitus TaxID=1461 RepID=A0A2W7PIZ1_9BACI|nr:hypothetical protein [Psychrobacillus insolitus]PZX08336.1 hypothetical protein C7437_1011460 [Psychrobacillus insolitus]